jgi:hypothetical protein
VAQAWRRCLETCDRSFPNDISSGYLVTYSSVPMNPKVSQVAPLNLFYGLKLVMNPCPRQTRSQYSSNVITVVGTSDVCNLPRPDIIPSIHCILYTRIWVLSSSPYGLPRYLHDLHLFQIRLFVIIIVIIILPPRANTFVPPTKAPPSNALSRLRRFWAPQ